LHVARVSLCSFLFLALSACAEDARVTVGSLVADDATYVAVVADEHEIALYACDSDTVAVWLSGDVVDGAFDLSSSEGAATGLIGENGIDGAFTIAGGSAVSFTTTDVVLETSGMWRSEVIQGENTVLAGVIVADDGEQRGALRTRPTSDPTATPTITPSATLDLTSGELTSAGGTITLTQIVSPRDIISPR
jgi:hypothetical protein